MASASELDPVFTKQQRIAELAKQSPHMGFTSLAHHIDLRWLPEAYLRTRPDGAPGVDGQTIRDYNANLGNNLRSLLERAKSGTYQAPPVRRVHIPKGTGPETRPIGIPTFEDKVLQRAVVMVLEAVYEQDFLMFHSGPVTGAHPRSGPCDGILIQATRAWPCTPALPHRVVPATRAAGAHPDS
jgi:RNA-directed DNA polymerase